MEYINVTNLSKKEARKLILERKQYYIDSLLPVYNINLITGSRLSSQHSEKIKALMSEIQISIDRTGENNPNFSKFLQKRLKQN